MGCAPYAKPRIEWEKDLNGGKPEAKAKVEIGVMIQ